MGLDLIDTLLAPCTHTFLLEVNVFSPENVSGYIVTAIAAIINLLISYFIIRHFIYKPIKKVSAQRKADIAKNLDSAKAAKAEAEAETEKIKAELADAKLKAATIIAQAKEQADTKRQIMLDAAKKEADRYLANKEAEQKLVWEAKEREQRDQAISLSLRVLQQLNSENNAPNTDQALVSQVVDALQKVEKDGKKHDAE